MTGFSADWLALREPFDRAAREAAAAAFDLPGLAVRWRGGGATLGVLDLACGTGANLRELAPRLGGAQRWRLVDHDPRLLAALPGALAAWAAAQGFTVRTQGDRLRVEGPGWRADVEAVHLDLAGGLAALPLAGVGLITASALLDLVSGAWLDALLSRACAAKAALLFALTVDGRIDWRPKREADEMVRRLFEAHQRGDKGFGPALGSRAVAVAADRLLALGGQLRRAASDWHIDGRQGAQAQAMLAALVEGSAAAAREQDPGAAGAVAAWAAERRQLLARTTLCIGHAELLADWP
ncbi:class I SAM-dependent methyltransferase [Variovorax sp. J22P271]|uniref:class I SAM-dependent methyltransferase n=1 Tax=Variovorax davisae TaxID=3053515 RepID=UPI0025789F3D|nr:class I SAM-dependent methyltransferase [Variovorax sp. J22P271]MDM0034638.1 class I SAM-dependent methyltransferase [Variovorax sp. J22P271]